jgi:hypothetical protein
MATSGNSTRTSTRATIPSGEAALAGRDLDKQSSPVLTFWSLEGSDIDTTVVMDARTRRSGAKAVARSAKVSDTSLAEKWGLSRKTVRTEGVRLTRGALAKAEVTKSSDDRDKSSVDHTRITDNDLRAAHREAKDANTMVEHDGGTPEGGTTSLLRSWVIPGVGLEGSSFTPSVDLLTMGESDAQTAFSTDGDDQAM